MPRRPLRDRGHSGHRIENLTLNNIRLEFEGEGTGGGRRLETSRRKEDAYPECQMFGVLPSYGLYCATSRACG